MGPFKILAFIVISILCCDPCLMAQEHNEFPIGTFMSDSLPDFYTKFDESGMNYMQTELVGIAKNNGAKLLGTKVKNDPILKYTSGYYSKWEAENTGTNDSTGLKHGSSGYETTYQQSTCWASSTAEDTVIYGPHYTQNRTYKWFNWQTEWVNYRADFRMAYDGPQQEGPVCRIYVIYKWEFWNNGSLYYKFDPLKVVDIFQNQFDGTSLTHITVDYDYRQAINPIYKGRVTGPDSLYYAVADTVWHDDYASTGIEFRIESMSLGMGTLYVDYLEIYDRGIWEPSFIDPVQAALSADSIIAHVTSYSDWNNINSWFAYEEPTNH